MIGDQGLIKSFPLLKGKAPRQQLWKRAWFACALVLCVATISHIHRGRTLPTSNDDLLSIAFEQRVTTGQIVRDALRLDAAIGGGNYDEIDPALESLEQRAKQWQQSHEILHSQTQAGIDDPIARLVNPHLQIERGLEELLLFAKSAQRRAPYLDQNTIDRVSHARLIIGSGEEQYSSALVQITSLRQRIIDERINAFASSSRAGLLVLFAVTVMCVPIVVFPTRSPNLDAVSSAADGREPDPSLKICKSNVEVGHAEPQRKRAA